MSDPLVFEWPIRVYYEDTDAGGIVFYANYLKFFERARTEWLRACGIDQQRLAESDGVVFVVKRTSVDYSAPARLDDVIRIASRIERLGRASVDFHQEAWRDGVLLATGDIRVASVNRASMRPAAIPEPVLDGLKRGPHMASIAIAEQPSLPECGSSRG
ncbi:tol-pal system-associated acyl-CoA thioesterase [Burkholderia sp. MR1]|nr:tol-pal system-associated acyl-CoA thioesterase [Burkholderia sp. MR1]